MKHHSLDVAVTSLRGGHLLLIRWKSLSESVPRRRSWEFRTAGVQVCRSLPAIGFGGSRIIHRPLLSILGHRRRSYTGFPSENCSQQSSQHDRRHGIGGTSSHRSSTTAQKYSSLVPTQRISRLWQCPARAWGFHLAEAASCMFELDSAIACLVLGDQLENGTHGVRSALPDSKGFPCLSEHFQYRCFLLTGEPRNRESIV